MFNVFGCKFGCGFLSIWRDKSKSYNNIRMLKRREKKMWESNWQHNNFLFFRFFRNFSFRTKWKEEHKEIDKNKLKFPFSHTVVCWEHFYGSTRQRYAHNIHYLAHLENVDMRNQTRILILYGDHEDNVIERNRFYRLDIKYIVES